VSYLDGFVSRHFTTFGTIPGTVGIVAVAILIGLLVGEWVWSLVFVGVAAVSFAVWWRRRGAA
jgi:hypothetical protein